MVALTHHIIKRVAILGSTGSIGVNTLEVIARHPDRFEVFALSASTRVAVMLQQCVQYRPVFAVMASEPHGVELAHQCKALGLPTRVLWGADAIAKVASDELVDIVMAAIVGAAGLASCLAAARAGKRLLLANKEALVVGGDYFLQAVQKGAPSYCRSIVSTPPCFNLCLMILRYGLSGSTRSY